MVVEGEQDFAVKLVIGFHSNQLCERGTEVAMYDYALLQPTIIWQQKHYFLLQTCME